MIFRVSPWSPSNTKVCLESFSVTLIHAFCFVNLFPTLVRFISFELSALEQTLPGQWCLLKGHWTWWKISYLAIWNTVQRTVSHPIIASLRNLWKRDCSAVSSLSHRFYLTSKLPWNLIKKRRLYARFWGSKILQDVVPCPWEVWNWSIHMSFCIFHASVEFASVMLYWN